MMITLEAWPLRPRLSSPQRAQEYAGSILSRLDNVMANLELMPLRMNASKQAKMGERQLALEKEFKKAGLLRP